MPDNRRHMANALRALAMDAVQKAKSGHPGMPMGFADVATVLWTQFLKYDAAAPLWPDRDRFVLSAGHGSMLLYGLLHLSGYAEITLTEIKNFRQLGSRCAGHPEYEPAAGIETTTGPLGQGFANAVGMAMAERALNAEFGDDLVNHKTYAVVGDGCLMEGISQEALTLAGHLRLNNLIVLFDDNGISIDGDVGLSDSTDQAARFAASGWRCLACDGHDFAAIESVLQEAQHSELPVFIACRTQIGFGSPSKSGSAAAHGAPLGEEEVTATRRQLEWNYPAFEIPAEILHAWRQAGGRGHEAHAAWRKRLAAHPQNTEFHDRMQKITIPQTAHKALHAWMQNMIDEPSVFATRMASQKVLQNLTPHMPSLIGGSADLTGSNNTKTECQTIFHSENYSGRYIHYGIRELGMAAAMNGIALHGGFIPYGGTFLVFSDYARSAMRLSALMGIAVIYVMTHDSIGLGEDGPTHQPIEHLAALRAIPDMFVFRPADPIETAEAWQLALAEKTAPSVIALTRQNVPLLRAHIKENLSAKGAYLLCKAESPHITLIATGSEVAIAAQTIEQLKPHNIRANLVSMPCERLFLKQSPPYQDKTLGSQPRIFMEAAHSQSWHKFMRPQDTCLAINQFGASAPAEKLYEHFNLTPETITQYILKHYEL